MVTIETIATVTEDSLITHIERTMERRGCNHD
jgi:hypothetical protein